jgi:hypothetical protein
MHPIAANQLQVREMFFQIAQDLMQAFQPAVVVDRQAFGIRTAVPSSTSP